MQHYVNSGSIEVEKVRGDENIADLLTKHQLAEAVNVRIGGERSDNMPKLSNDQINLLHVLDPYLIGDP